MAATTLPAQGSLIQTTTQNDGLAIINGGRRLVELPFRHNVDDHDVYRAAVGIRGNFGDVSDSFFRNVSYDVYYRMPSRFTPRTSRTPSNKWPWPRCLARHSTPGLAR